MVEPLLCSYQYLKIILYSPQDVNGKAYSSSDDESSQEEKSEAKISKKFSSRKKKPKVHIEYEEDTPSTSKAKELTF